MDSFRLVGDGVKIHSFAWINRSGVVLDGTRRASERPSRSGEDFILEPNGLPGLITEVKPTVDALTIEMNSEVRSRDRKAHGFRSKRGETETTLVPKTAIDDATRSGLAELAS